MSDEKNLKPEETRAIQSAIEKLADEEIPGLPHLSPLPAPEAESGEPPAVHAALTPPARKPAEKKPVRPRLPKHAAAGDCSGVSDWFFTFMCMNIPIIGWIYLFRLARGKGRSDRREFARAYLFYKLLFLLIGLILLIIVGLIAMNLLDQLLAYMQML